MIAILQFRQCIQDSHEVGTGNEHMNSRIFLYLILDGKAHEVIVDVRQSAGASFQDDPIEVVPIKKYKGPFNYMGFRDAVERYYRMLFGPNGRGIRFSNVGQVTMKNNLIQFPYEERIEIDSNSPAW